MPTDKHGYPWLTRRRGPEAQLWNSFQHGHCDYCGEVELHEGPRAGACINVLCMFCGQRYNIAIYMGQLLIIQIVYPAPRVPTLEEEDLFPEEFVLSSYCS